MKETWMDIRCFPNYQVSNDGNVRSKDRTIIGGKWNCVRKIKGVILREGFSHNGYAHVTLRRNNKAFTKRVHALVSEAFLGKKPSGLVIHHIDGDKTNNCVNNLEYTTHSNNSREHHKLKGVQKGSVPICDISKIQERINNGEKLYEIAKEYNISRNDISCIYRVIALTGEELEFKTLGK